MFEGFQLETLEVSDATLRFRHCGHGPAVILLHGHPRTHMTWGKVAEILSRSFTVVCPDLRGFGQSSKPADTRDHSGSSKRAKAQDCVELMAHLGHESFSIVGHDRGSYVAFRAAMDHPARIHKLAVLDGVPIAEALGRCDARFSQLWWHWFFFAQPEKPERAILADPTAWYVASPEFMGDEAYADFRQAIQDPATVHAMVEDYRAGLGIDRRHDEEDRAAGRTVQCPTLCLWSKRDDIELLYGDPLAVWRPWAPSVTGHSIDSGHHMPEETPEELSQALRQFLSDN